MRQTQPPFIFYNVFGYKQNKPYNDHTILITLGLLSVTQGLGDEYDEYDATDQKGAGHNQEIVFSQLTKNYPKLTES
jgi:hypothetical protein